MNEKAKRKKELVFLGIEEIDHIPEQHLTAVMRKNSSIFALIHRSDGVGDYFLRTSLHWHNYYEFEVVYGGSGIHILGQSSCSMGKGFVCLRTPQTLHSTIQKKNDPLRLYNIKFSEDFFPKEIAPHFLTEETSAYTYCSPEVLPSFIEKIDRIFGELNNRDEYTVAMVRAIFSDLLCSFFRLLRRSVQSTETNLNHYVEEIVRYINENFRTDITVNLLAKQFHLTPNYLGSLFIQGTGQSCAAYILGMRMKLAVQLLVNTSLSVNDIAEQSGFHSASYFIRKFKEVYGVSPTVYRMNL